MVDVLISEFLVRTRHLEAGPGLDKGKNRRPDEGKNRGLCLKVLSVLVSLVD